MADQRPPDDVISRRYYRAHFYRKITALTGLPVNVLITNFRLERGAQLLSQQWGPVSQVAYEVGFSNQSYFSKRFKEKFGVSPSEYSLKNREGSSDKMIADR